MTWPTTKLAIKKAWVVLKNYWYVPALIVYTLAMWIVFRKDNKRLIKMFDIADQKYREEINILNKTHKEEIEKRNMLIEEHRIILENIEEEYDVKIDDLEKKKKKELDKVVRENKENPDKLAEEMSKLFGVKNV